MEFGAIQCRPKNPDCESCPLRASCKALEGNEVSNLPVKLKKTKVTKRFFNYLVIKTSDNSTVFEKRTQKGIWQNLYQFPLIESDKEIEESFIQNTQLFNQVFGDKNPKIYKYNGKPWIHKLSHQHLHVTFWILETDQNFEKDAAKIPEIFNYPTSALIAKFLEEFF